MRDLVMLVFFLLYVPRSLRSVFAGYLLWGWTGLISVNAYLYGYMAGLPYVQIFAAATFVGIFLWRDKHLRFFSLNRTLVWMGLFVAHGFVSAVLAFPELDRNWELFGNLAKTVLFCAVMPMLVTNRLRIHAMVIMLALAVSFHGVLDGLKFLLSGGAHNARGIEKFGDNNQFALVLLMVIPLLIYLFQYSSKWFVRWGFGATAVLTVLAIVATHSRGGLLGLFAVATWMVVVIKGRYRIASIMIITISALLVFQFAPRSWSERMNTIQQAGEDTSFLGRVTAWKVSSAIALEHPFFGGGFRAVQSYQVWDRFKDAPGLLDFIYTPPVNRSGLAAHSIWFEILGDLGFVGLFFFVALLINSFVTRREIVKIVSQSRTDLQWAGDLANLLAAVLFIYVVTGSLLSAGYFEMPYIVMMLMEVLKLSLRNETIHTNSPASP